MFRYINIFKTISMQFFNTFFKKKKKIFLCIDLIGSNRTIYRINKKNVLRIYTMYNIQCIKLIQKDVNICLWILTYLLDTVVSSSNLLLADFVAGGP